MRDDTNAATTTSPPWQGGLAAYASPESGSLCLIGPSAAAGAIRAALSTLAPSDYPLLLRGAKGTGKRDFAEELHGRGGRSGDPFGVLDFAAADQVRTGRAARGLPAVATGRVIGTWYVPEVETLSHAQQGALIAALAASRGRTRVVVGTSADVDQLSIVGWLRPDLMSLFPVSFTLPRLRDRLEDVATIAECCIHRWSQATGAAPPFVTDSAVAQLRDYSWPGNVRELEEVIATACARASGRSLTADAISAALGRRPRRRAGDDVLPLREIERNYILVAVARCGDNHSLAARRLGIGRNTLLRKLPDVGTAT